MTTTVALAVPRFRAFTQAGGAPLVGGKVYTYAAGTLTPKATYTDLAGGAVNANPVILDVNGEATIRLDLSAGGYKIILKDSADVTQWTLDDIDSSLIAALGTPGLSSNNIFTGTWNKFASVEPRIIMDDTDASSDKRLWDFDANSGVWSLRTRTDADGSGKNILVVTRGTATAIATIDIGNATDAPNINVNGSPLVLSQTTTGILGNCTTAPTCSVYLTRSGKIATATITAITTGTSNDGLLTLTGCISANFQPVRQQAPTCVFTNNGVLEVGLAFITASDTITFGRIPNAAFTSSGTKGVYYMTLTWELY